MYNLNDFKPSHERRAAALREPAMRHLEAVGFDPAVLWMLDDNSRTRRFFDNRGWEATGETLHGAGAPELRYRLGPLQPSRRLCGRKFAGGET